MFTLYNNFNFCSINFDTFFYNLELSSKYPDIHFDSILTRISRFLNNSHNYFHSLFDNVIKYIFSSFKIKHEDNRVFISFDHMFVKNKFTIFMLSIKVGKQGFPIYFNVFDGKGKENFGDAFKLKHIKEALSYIHNLMKSISEDIDIVFLADRWFDNFFPLFNFIHYELKDLFVFRCKNNFKILYFNKSENHKIWCTVHDLPNLKYHSCFFENLEFTQNRYKYNFTICKSDNHQERWFLISNIDPKRAKKFYAYRFGGIETIFKNQKSNGFYLEKTGLKYLHAFDNLYSLLCIATSYYICLGTDLKKIRSAIKI